MSFLPCLQEKPDDPPPFPPKLLLGQACSYKVLTSSQLYCPNCPNPRGSSLVDCKTTEWGIYSMTVPSPSKQSRSILVLDPVEYYIHVD